MSRVDEAIRRAAQRSGGKTPNDESTPGIDPLTMGDAATLAREPFPVEIAEVRRSRPPVSVPPPVPPPVKPPVPAAPAAFAPVMAAASRSAPAAPDAPRPGSLFERIDSRLAEKVVVDTNMLPASREQYRRLAATLHHAQTANGLKVVMIASAVPGEGKTLTAANLALTLSESYQRQVLLIDADLRRPELHNLFRIDNTSGLSEGLMSVDEHKLPVRQVSQRLAILPAGSASSDPMAGLTSERMRRLIDEARHAFDWVIIDTPPVGLLPDANLLAAMVDGAVIVVKAGSTPYDLVRRAIDAIGRERTLGVVLNRAALGDLGSAHDYYGHYYNSQSQVTQGS